jgi:hypothetical protein
MVEISMKKVVPHPYFNLPFVFFWCIITFIAAGDPLGNSDRHAARIEKWYQTIPLDLLEILLLAIVGAAIMFLLNHFFRLFIKVESNELYWIVWIGGVSTLVTGVLGIVSYYLLV